jgi:spermidine synthase
MTQTDNRDTVPGAVYGYVAFIALSTLFYELTLIRVLDILWYPHFSYMVITLALLGFGIAGVMTSIFAHRLQWKPVIAVSLTLTLAASYVGVFVLLSCYRVDFISFSSIVSLALRVFWVFSGLLVPFFLSGLILSLLFTEYADRFGRLYAWDLTGASMGCILVPLLIPTFGGPGLLFVVSGLTLLAAALLVKRTGFRIPLVLLSLVAMAYPFVGRQKGWDYLEIPFHMNKRGIIALTAIPPMETHWDRIARIDLIKYTELYTWIAYDGGTQTSYYYDFDGDYEKLRAELPENSDRYFWDRFVYASHWLKEGSNARVLIIGAAGGQETKAAIAFGASEVDAVEMVGTVIRRGKEEYAVEPYTNPKVNAVQGEGRSYLRSCNKTYDIIQMMSNHTSASIASGSGAVSPNYLQTVEAYQEYFGHLSENGVLQVNHHVYPKMILIAANAWKNMGRKDFSRHVLLYYSQAWANLPTLLIKMSPWTREEFDRVHALMGKEFKLIHNPLEPATRMDPGFFTGKLPAELEKAIPYRIEVATDNQPFFNHFRKHMRGVSYKEPYVDTSLRILLNDSIKHGVPMDVIHLIVTTGVALVIAVFCLFSPLLFSRVGRAPWTGKPSFVTYFACLGAGFIGIELIFIQLFHKLIGFPLYTYATVVFAFLLAAGAGSFLTDKYALAQKKLGRLIPFIGIPLYGSLLLLLNGVLLDFFLQWPTMIRILATVALIFPLGVFLGMPFALGIAGSYNKGRGALGWAWAVNGLFTVLGSVLSIVSATYIGFVLTLYGAFALYILAGILLPRFATITGSRDSV